MSETSVEERERSGDSGDGNGRTIINKTERDSHGTSFLITAS